jgi:hypothetical protein
LEHPHKGHKVLVVHHHKVTVVVEVDKVLPILDQKVQQDLRLLVLRDLVVIKVH